MDSDDATVLASNQDQGIQAEADVLYRTARASQLRRRPAIRSADRENGVSLRDTAADPTPDEVIALSTARSDRPFEIRCGAGLASSVARASHKPYPLPLLPSSLKRKYSDTFLTSPRPENAPSNGCGELIDSEAYPQPSLDAWVSTRPAHVAVLNDRYASTLSAEESIRTLGTQSCGCVRQLIGCTTWWVFICTT